MKAAVLFEVNKPLVIEDVSVPNPGPREVLIRTRVAGPTAFIQLHIEMDGEMNLLRAHEIYNLKLPADLVVLSACQTGLGKEIKGEGLVGLTRGFMYAGAPRVVEEREPVLELDHVVGERTLLRPEDPLRFEAASARAARRS